MRREAPRHPPRRRGVACERGGDMQRTGFPPVQIVFPTGCFQPGGHSVYLNRRPNRARLLRGVPSDFAAEGANDLRALQSSARRLACNLSIIAPVGVWERVWERLALSSLNGSGSCP